MGGSVPPVRGMTEEGRIERDIRSLLGSLGWTVYKLSQGYRKARGGTRMTPGIPDLWAFHTAKQLTLWVEVKPPKEMVRLEKLRTRKPPIPKSYHNDWKRAHAQHRFGELCRQTGHPYAYGGIPEVLTELRRLGFALAHPS